MTFIEALSFVGLLLAAWGCVVAGYWSGKQEIRDELEPIIRVERQVIRAQRETIAKLSSERVEHRAGAKRGIDGRFTR